MSMFNESQNISVGDDAQVTNAGRDVINIHATTINNHPPPASRVVAHQRSLVTPPIHSKSPQWTPKNRICRAQQRISSTLDLLNKYDDVIDEDTFLKCNDFLVNSTAESEIEDKGWVAFVCHADYRKRLLNYTADVKKINKIAQRASQQGVCLQVNAHADQLRQSSGNSGDTT